METIAVFKSEQLEKMPIDRARHTKDGPVGKKVATYFGICSGNKRSRSKVQLEEISIGVYI